MNQPNPETIRSAYKTFFTSEPGKHFITTLNVFMSEHITRAENEPELARDHMQRCAGIREIVNHIQTVIQPKKEGKPKESS